MYVFTQSATDSMRHKVGISAEYRMCDFDSFPSRRLLTSEKLMNPIYPIFYP